MASSSRVWTLALPAVTVLVVTYSLLVAGVPRKIVGARVYGGPTEGVSVLALRVETVTREGESERPFWPGAVSVSATSPGAAPVTASVTHTAGGVTEIALDLRHELHGPIDLVVRDSSGALLASGQAMQSVAHWAARARHRGGWIRGRDSGGLVLSAAPERGAFIVGSSEPLSLRLERNGKPVPDAALTVSAEGAQLSGTDNLRTDARGRAQLTFTAVDLNPTVRAEARTDEGQTAAIDSGMPVVPGGFSALRTATGIRVESAVPRQLAYFSVVTGSARLTGGVLALSPDGRGGSVGTAELPAFPQPAWVVVSSEVDQNTVAAIGWPLDSSAEPAQTFDVPESLLLDGLPSAFAREQARRWRVRRLTVLFIALAFALNIALLVLRVRAADRDIARHLQRELERETAARIAPRRLLPVLVAVLVLGLGFVAFGLIVAARSR